MSTTRDKSGVLRQSGGNGTPIKGGGQYAVDAKAAPAGFDLASQPDVPTEPNPDPVAREIIESGEHLGVEFKREGPKLVSVINLVPQADETVARYCSTSFDGEISSQQFQVSNGLRAIVFRAHYACANEPDSHLAPADRWFIMDSYGVTPTYDGQPYSYPAHNELIDPRFAVYGSSATSLRTWDAPSKTAVVSLESGMEIARIGMGNLQDKVAGANFNEAQALAKTRSYRQGLSLIAELAETEGVSKYWTSYELSHALDDFDTSGQYPTGDALKEIVYQKVQWFRPNI